ncbi:hypothetical protein DZG01_03880 [Pseudomonas fluorescens]|nr:hypothetical protein DZG01_03880 [Pseudomonas fluorescens]
MGASLLAMTVGQLAYLSTDTPLSRAGSLPQGVSARFRIFRSNWQSTCRAPCRTWPRPFPSWRAR